MSVLKIIYFLLLVFLISGCANRVTVTSLQEANNVEMRLHSIARKILTANLALCPEQKKYYGFKVISLNKGIAPEIGKIWSEAFHLQNRSTVILVISGGAGAQAGLHVGDQLFSVNGVKDSFSDMNRSEFTNELHAAILSPKIEMVVLRNEEKIALSLKGEDACAANVVLLAASGSNAYANGKYILIEAGLARLLPDDDELAFIIAHELAHIIRGDVTPERESDLQNKTIRSTMEKGADALGIRLMMQAGFDPEGATRAIAKLDYANRGPIARWLGLYGAYMPTAERIKFLRASAALD